MLMHKFTAMIIWSHAHFSKRQNLAIRINTWPLAYP